VVRLGGKRAVLRFRQQDIESFLTASIREVENDARKKSVCL
jgi:hypothetical protein